MARIPIDPAQSSVVAQAAPAGRQFPKDAFGGGVAQAIGDIGRQGMQIAGQQIDAQQRADDQARREAEHAAKVKAKRIADEQAALAEAAQKAETFRVVTGAEDGITDLHDTFAAGVRDGTVPKADAESKYREAAAKYITDAGTALPETLDKPLVMARLARNAERLQNGVRTAVADRDRHDVTADMTTTLASLQRQYGKDPAGATAKAMGVIEALGPHSKYQPEQLAALAQGWKEDTQGTAAWATVEAARGSVKGMQDALKGLNRFPDLKPQTLATLRDRGADDIMRTQTRAAQQAEHNARMQEAKLKHAEAAYNAALGLADYGTLSEGESQKVLLQTAGTPYQDAFKAIIARQAETGPLTRQPPAAVQQAITTLNADIAANGIDTGKQKRLQQLETIQRGQEKDIKADPRRAYADRYLPTPEAPLDTGSLQSVVAGLTARAQVGVAASQWSGQPVAPLYAAEIEPVQRMLEVLPAKERAGAVAALANALGPQASSGLAAQIDSKDRALGLAFGMAGSATTEGRFTSELVLKGAQAKKDGTSTKGEKEPDVKAARWKATAAAELADVFPTPGLTSAYRDAAEFIMHGIAAEKGGQLSKDDMTRAVGLAIGGTLVEHNGRKTPLPAGITADTLDSRLRSVTPAEMAAQVPDGVVRAAGVPMPLADFVKSLPGQELIYAGPGKYNVLVQGRPVVNSGGRRIVVGVQ